MKFPTKGYGRIFCKTPEDREKVINIMKSINQYEVEDYLPDDLITCEQIEKTQDGLNYIIPLSYTHKFDEIDLNELQLKCFLENIPILIWNTDISYDHSGNDYRIVPIIHNNDIY